MNSEVLEDTQAFLVICLLGSCAESELLMLTVADLDHRLESDRIVTESLTNAVAMYNLPSLALSQASSPCGPWAFSMPGSHLSGPRVQ